MYAELIKIEDNTCYENRTKKYLMPLLKSYEILTKYFHSIEKIAYGINDIIVLKCGVQYKNCIFILFKNSDSIFTHNLLKTLKEESFYVDDYSFDNVLNFKYHMLVLKFPIEYENSYKLFEKGKYSKMFTKKEIQTFFKKEDTISILKKELEYKDIFKKKLQSEFNYVDYIPDYLCEEYDLPISQRQEIFNFKFN